MSPREAASRWRFAPVLCSQFCLTFAFGLSPFLRGFLYRKVPKGTNWYYTLGSATMFASSACHFGPVQLVGVVGTDYPVEKLYRDVKILDIFGRTASVRVDAEADLQPPALGQGQTQRLGPLPRPDEGAERADHSQDAGPSCAARRRRSTPLGRRRWPPPGRRTPC